MSASRLIPVATKNLVFRFFRLYFPLSQISHFDWANDWSSQHDFSIYIAAEKESPQTTKWTHRILNGLNALVQPKVEEKPAIRKKLKELGFIEILDPSHASSQWRGQLRHYWRFSLSKELLENPAAKLKKEKAAPELFTLEDYLIKVKSLLLKDLGVQCHKKICDVFDEQLTEREKFVKLQRTIFQYSKSYFQKKKVKAFLTELLLDSPAIMAIQQDQLKEIDQSHPRFQACPNEPKKLSHILRLISRHLSNPQGIHATALFANLIALISDFMKQNIDDPVQVLLGFLIKEKKSHLTSSSTKWFSYFSKSDREMEDVYVNKLRWVTAKINVDLIQQDKQFKCLPDEELVRKYDEYMNKGNKLTNNAWI